MNSISDRLATLAVLHLPPPVQLVPVYGNQASIDTKPEIALLAPLVVIGTELSEFDESAMNQVNASVTSGTNTLA